MSIRVMIVDDSLFVCEEMKYLLEDTEFEIVHYCRNGEQAVQCYKEIAPDVVTMDIILPGIDGFDAARAILQHSPDARIVFVSSLAYDDDMEQAKDLGCQEFIFKPFKKRRLISSLLRAVGKEPPEEIAQPGK